MHISVMVKSCTSLSLEGTSGTMQQLTEDLDWWNLEDAFALLSKASGDNMIKGRMLFKLFIFAKNDLMMFNGMIRHSYGLTHI